MSGARDPAIRWLVVLTALFPSISQAADGDRLPNVIFILADDLGYGDLGCYGQKRIRTPRLDGLAREGMRFTQHYSGHNVCAPSRCVLMTGLHPGHAYVRDNRQAAGFPEGQTPVPEVYLTLPLTFKRLGYVVGGFGKWGLGPMTSTGDPLKQGFDRWFGYNCQASAHNFYPARLWDNDKPTRLDNPLFSAHQPLPKNADPFNPASYERYRGKEYAPDLIGEQARKFVQAHRDRPFFLYYPTTVPHLALQVPEDSLAEYDDAFDEEPYTGDARYLPHPRPKSAYAAMITRMDRDVGRLLDLVAEMGLTKDTIVVFSSDNGAASQGLGGTDGDYFDSVAGLRGRKGDFYEGGFRVPCLVRWVGRVPAGQTSDFVSGFEDWLPTLLELIGRKDEPPQEIDGISLVPTLLGQPQPARAFLYRESPGEAGQQMVRVGSWKAIRSHREAKKSGAIEAIALYDLANDPKETVDRSNDQPALVAQMNDLMTREHRPSSLFPIPWIDSQVAGKRP